MKTLIRSLLIVFALTVLSDKVSANTLMAYCRLKNPATNQTIVSLSYYKYISAVDCFALMRQNSANSTITNLRIEYFVQALNLNLYYYSLGTVTRGAEVYNCTVGNDTVQSPTYGTYYAPKAYFYLVATSVADCVTKGKAALLADSQKSIPAVPKGLDVAIYFRGYKGALIVR